MFSLTNKSVVITGGGSGIGRAISLLFAKQGAEVNILELNEAAAQDTVAEIRSEGGKANAYACNVTNQDAVKTVFATIGRVDILINNAGIAAFGKFLELEPSAWERIIQVNLMGTYYVTRAVLPNMIERQTGDIINISSTAGLSGNALTSAYSASKFAVLGLTDSLMQEVRKHNIRVTALTPSTVATDMAKELNLTDGNPEKVMQAEDMAELIIAQLKLNRRVFIKNSSIWSTNP